MEIIFIRRRPHNYRCAINVSASQTTGKIIKLYIFATFKYYHATLIVGARNFQTFSVLSCRVMKDFAFLWEQTNFEPTNQSTRNFARLIKLTAYPNVPIKFGWNLLARGLSACTWTNTALGLLSLISFCSPCLHVEPLKQFSCLIAQTIGHAHAVWLRKEPLEVNALEHFV